MAKRYRVSLIPEGDRTELKIEHLKDVKVSDVPEDVVYVECAHCGAMPRDTEEFTCLHPEGPCPLLALNVAGEEADWEDD